jgi:hypothetical protein
VKYDPPSAAGKAQVSEPLAFRRAMLPHCWYQTKTSAPFVACGSHPLPPSGADAERVIALK